MLSWIRNIVHKPGDAHVRQQWWDARKVAMESVLGPCDGTIFHAASPLHRQGCADVLRFRQYLKDGVAYATCDLIGNPRQLPNKWGHYELMMCVREENSWAPRLLSRLGQYTHEATLHPGDTMDLGDERPNESTIGALLLARPDPPADSFCVLGTPANIILAIGITANEFAGCKTYGSGVLLRMLRDRGIFPYTDMRRNSLT